MPRIKKITVQVFLTQAGPKAVVQGVKPGDLTAAQMAKLEEEIKNQLMRIMEDIIPPPPPASGTKRPMQRSGEEADDAKRARTVEVVLNVDDVVVKQEGAEGATSGVLPAAEGIIGRDIPSIDDGFEEN